MAIWAGLAGRVGAEPWSVEPRLGVSADYSTNPLLAQSGGVAEAHVAGLLDMPLRYDADGIDFLFRPSGRISNSQGYSSLASNYEHVSSNLQINNDLGSTSVQAGWARDSSLYYVGSLVNGLGVRRDTESTSADWSRATTERSQIQIDASWSRVEYDQPETLDYLTDYRYLSAGPTFSIKPTERMTLQLLGSIGRYQSLNGLTSSDSTNLQLGLVRQLTEIWTVNLSAGYSRSLNREKFYFESYLLGTLDSTQEGGVYSATFSRQGEGFNLSASVSQALQPTGFAFLSRQDSVNLTATYVRSDRWDYAVSTAWIRAINPVLEASGSVSRNGEGTTRYLNAQFIANWHWSTRWIISMHAIRITQRYGPPDVAAGSSGFGIDIARQFLREDL